MCFGLLTYLAAQQGVEVTLESVDGNTSIGTIELSNEDDDGRDS